jgi:Ubiquitin binding region
MCREVMQMLGQMAIDFKLFRGIGVQMTKLTEKKKKKGRLSQFVTKGVPKQPQKPPTPAVSVPEIDQDVLAELPEDIRQEILREYKFAPAPREPIAGPSTSGSCFKSAAEISFSQVDPSFLDALPDYLKMELVAELKSDRTRRGADKVLFTGKFTNWF